MTVLVLLLVGSSVLIIGLAIPLIRGKVKPNHWYGLRIPATLNNPELWYPANAYAGWLLLVYGIALLVVSLGLPLLLRGLPEEAAANAYGLAVSAVMLLGLVPVVILSLRYVRRLERELDKSPGG